MMMIMMVVSHVHSFDLNVGILVFCNSRKDIGMEIESFPLPLSLSLFSLSREPYQPAIMPASIDAVRVNVLRRRVEIKRNLAPHSDSP